MLQKFEMKLMEYSILFGVIEKNITPIKNDKLTLSSFTQIPLKPLLRQNPPIPPN